MINRSSFPMAVLHYALHITFVGRDARDSWCVRVGG